MDRLVLRREFLEAQLASMQDMTELEGMCAREREREKEKDFIRNQCP